MQSILREIFNGKIYPDEQIYPKSPEYHKLNSKISNEMNYFQDMLSDEDYYRFENLYGLYNETSSMEGEESFIYGFKLASLIMFEVFNGKLKSSD